MSKLDQSKAIVGSIVATAARRLSRVVPDRDSAGLEPGDWYVVASGTKRRYLVLWEQLEEGRGFIARFELLVQPVCVHVRLGTGDLQSVVDLGTPAGVVCRLWHETKVDTVALVRVPADKAYVVGRLIAAVHHAEVLRWQTKT